MPGPENSQKLCTASDKAASTLVSRYPYLIPVLCVALNSRKFVVFAFDAEGGRSRVLRVWEVRRGKGYSLREHTGTPACKDVFFVYNMYIQWCLQRIAAGDIHWMAYKDHTHVKA